MKKKLQPGFVFIIVIMICSFAFPKRIKAQSQDGFLAENVSFVLKSPATLSKSHSDNLKPIKLDYVNDYENIYTEDELQFLKLLVMDFEKKTSIQINIVTFDFSMIVKNDSSAVAFSFPDSIYADEDGNNKVIVKICVDRRMIQIDGADKTGKLISPHESKKIINSAFLPFFQKRKIFEGSINGLKALMKELKSKQISKD
ncbi:MAG TPA: TPM domain-containing protein [Puia sp.]|nr:TPM domain-containing protein [Puia sp.]